MKKHTITHDYNPVQKGLKKQKLQSINAPKNKEIYSFSQDCSRKFTSPSIRGICLHETEPLIAVSSHYRRSPYFKPQSGIRIYTLDGDLVTLIGASYPVGMYLSATMMVTRNVKNMASLVDDMTRYNDYSVKNLPLIIRFFDCDMNENIYSPPMEMFGYRGDLSVLSPDLDFIKPFKLQSNNIVCSIRIKGDSMALLFRIDILYSSPHQISLYSLSREEPLRTVKLPNRHKLFYPYMTFDQLQNIIINDSDQIAVWYLGGRVRYYKTRRVFGFYHHRKLGVQMAQDFKLIQTLDDYLIEIFDATLK